MTNNEAAVIIRVLIGIVVAAVTLWLLSFAVPTFIAAVVALLIFFLIFLGKVGPPQS